MVEMWLKSKSMAPVWYVMGMEPETSSVNKLLLSNNWLIEPLPCTATVNNWILFYFYMDENNKQEYQFSSNHAIGSGIW